MVPTVGVEPTKDLRPQRSAYANSATRAFGDRTEIRTQEAFIPHRFSRARRYVHFGILPYSFISFVYSLSFLIKTSYSVYFLPTLIELTAVIILEGIK